MHLSIVHNQTIKDEHKIIISKKETNEAWEKELFQCDICDSQFMTKHTLKNHTASIHEMKKLFKSILL